MARPKTLRRSIAAWRARLSIPTLLARWDERTVVSVIAAANGGVAILVISAFAWITNVPLLFPALGPSAFILFTSPFAPAAAPRSVIIGHFAAIICGCTVWHIMNVIIGTPLALTTTGWPAIIAAALALALCALSLVILSCPHAPACATALIVALGAADGPLQLAGMATGVVLLATQAVVIGRLAGIRVPLWSPLPQA
ncbi:MAG: HPP family protein [Phycisphaerae bacterium]|nr:HPP family protein [Phycisphaerae bacterium]